MPIDTTKTIKTKDSTNLTKTFTEKTTVIEITNKDKTESFLKYLDFVSSVAWPIFAFILIFSFKRNFVELFTSLISKLKTSDIVNISTNGISLSSSEFKLKETVRTKNDILPSIDDFDDMSKKLLSTLWIQQLEYDRSFNKRFTFTLGTNHPYYSDFDKSSQILRISGLVTLALNNGQLFLTNTGIVFCEKNSIKLGEFSFFKPNYES